MIKRTTKRATSTRPYAILGRLIEKRREAKGVLKNKAMVALGYKETSGGELSRYERGERKPPRDWLISFALQALKENRRTAIDELLEAAHYDILSADECVNFGVSDDGMKSMSAPQKVRWAPASGQPPGIVIDGPGGFIAWDHLSKEIEERLFCQLGRHIPMKCRAVLDEFRGRKNWVVRIIDPNGAHKGFVWFGTNPDNKWAFDGLVRVGTAVTDNQHEVWQIFERYSDASYRRVEARSQRIPVLGADRSSQR